MGSVRVNGMGWDGMGWDGRRKGNGAERWTTPHHALTVPDGEGDVLVVDRLHVEADGGDGVHVLPQLQPVQDRRLARRVQAEHPADRFDSSIEWLRDGMVSRLVHRLVDDDDDRSVNRSTQCSSTPRTTTESSH